LTHWASLVSFARKPTLDTRKQANRTSGHGSATGIAISVQEQGSTIF